MNEQNEYLYEFDSFRVDALKRQLTREGNKIVPLTSKAFEALLFLVRRRGEMVSKNELIAALWADVTVEENNLTQQISTLRKALGEKSGNHQFIITVPGQGYSFIAPVKEISSENESDFLLQEFTHSSITIDVDDETAGEAKTHRPDVNDGSQISPAKHQHTNNSGIVGALRSQLNVFTFTSVLLILVIVAAAAFWFYMRDSNAAKPLAVNASPKTIAVLPFKSLVSSADDRPTNGEDFLGTGMSDTLIAKLGNVPNLNVRPTSQIVKYANQNSADALAAGRELKTDAVLEGTIQRSGERVRVTVQMLDVQTGKLLWGQSFDEKFSDIFVLQDAISADVARVLQIKLTNEEQKEIHKHSTENLEAYQAYLRGRYFWNKRDNESLGKGIEYFEQAVKADPNYAMAYSGIADSYLIINYYYLNRTSPEETLQKAKQAAQKALELDDTLAEAHTSLAFIYFFSGSKTTEASAEAAEKEFKRAIELNPDYATAHHWYSDFLAMNGRDEESLREIKLAVNLDPLSPIINTTLGERFFYTRRYDEAIAQLHQTIEIDDRFATAHYLLAMAYEQKEMPEAAIAEAERACALTKSEDYEAALAHVYASSGKKSEAKKILSDLTARRAHPHAIALIYAGLGDENHALQWLEQLDKAKARWFLKNDPRLDTLRSKLKFQSLIAE